MQKFKKDDNLDFRSTIPYQNAFNRNIQAGSLIKTLEQI
jgi:hypothetical protein